MSSSGVFLCFDLVPTRDKLSHFEGHHEISTSYLNAIELLPIWIMFIDRIIDKIWFSAVTLSTELLNLAQIEPYCRVVVECGSLWQRKIPPSNDVHSVDVLVLYGNAIYSVQGIVFNGINPRQNHTAADAFLNYLRHFTMIESMVGFPLLPPPHLLSFFS